MIQLFLIVGASNLDKKHRTFACAQLFSCWVTYLLIKSSCVDTIDCQFRHTALACVLYQVFFKFIFFEILGTVNCICKHSIAAYRNIVVSFVDDTCIENFVAVVVDKSWVEVTTWALKVQMLLFYIMRHSFTLVCGTTKVSKTHRCHWFIIVDVVICQHPKEGQVYNK